MKHKFTLTIWGILFTLSSVFATNRIISFGSNYYNPSNFTVMVGDTITWQGDFSHHPLSTTAIPSGAIGIYNVSSGNSYSYKVVMAGLYRFRCIAGSITGMEGSFTAETISDVEETATQPDLAFQLSTVGRTLRISNLSEAASAGYKVQVSSILGTRIYEGNMADKEHSIDLQSYPESIYMLSISDENNRPFVRKFMLH